MSWIVAGFFLAGIAVFIALEGRRPPCTAQPGCRCHTWRPATPAEMKFLDPSIQANIHRLRARGGLRTKAEERELRRLVAHNVVIPEPATWRGKLAEKALVWRLAGRSAQSLYDEMGRKTAGATTDDRAPSARS